MFCSQAIRRTPPAEEAAHTTARNCPSPGHSYTIRSYPFRRRLIIIPGRAWVTECRLASAHCDGQEGMMVLSTDRLIEATVTWALQRRPARPRGGRALRLGFGDEGAICPPEGACDGSAQ